MAFRSSTSNTGFSTGAISTAVPSGATAGDIAVLFFCGDDNTPGESITWPVGFTELVNSSASLANQSQAVAWKRLTTADSGTYDVSFDDSLDVILIAALFSGRHVSDVPFVTEAFVLTPETSPVSVNATGLTAVTGDDLIWFGGIDPLFSGDLTGAAPPAGYTERHDIITTWLGAEMATRDNVSEGATGTVTGIYSLSAFSTYWCAYLVRIPSDEAEAVIGTDQTVITLRSGHATPSNIVMRSLPVREILSTPIYLYPGAASATDIVLRDPRTAQTVSGAISGSSTLTFTSSGELVGAGALSGSSSITFDLTGNLENLVGSGAISGSTSLTFTASGVLVGAGALSGSTSLTFSPAGTLRGSGALAGATTLTFTPSAALVGAGALSGSSGVTFTLSGLLAGVGGLSGATSLAFTPSGTLTGSGALSGATTITFDASGNLTNASGGAGDMSGSTSLTFTTSGNLAGAGALAGATSLTFTPTAVLGGVGALSGASSLTFETSGALQGSGALSGGSLLSFAPSGALAGAGSLSGSSSITFTPSGDLTNAPGAGAMSGTTSITFTATGNLTGEDANAFHGSGGGRGTRTWVHYIYADNDDEPERPKERRKRKPVTVKIKALPVAPVAPIAIDYEDEAIAMLLLAA